MIKEKNSVLKSLAALAASLVMTTPAMGAIVYDAATPVGTVSPEFHVQRGAPGNQILEFGDQIVLGGSDRLMTDFQAEYFLDLGTSPTAGNETYRLRMYRNNGTAGAPGTLFYDSDLQVLTEGAQLGYDTIVANQINLTIPTTFTWTIFFGGIETGEDVGLILNPNPAVGSSLVDFWARAADGSWGTIAIDGGATPGTFAARVNATVPEPGTYAMLIGGLSALGLMQYRRRNK